MFPKMYHSRASLPFANFTQLGFLWYLTKQKRGSFVWHVKNFYISKSISVVFGSKIVWTTFLKYKQDLYEACKLEISAALTLGANTQYYPTSRYQMWTYACLYSLGLTGPYQNGFKSLRQLATLGRLSRDYLNPVLHYSHLVFTVKTIRMTQ